MYAGATSIRLTLVISPWKLRACGRQHKGLPIPKARWRVDFISLDFERLDGKKLSRQPRAGLSKRCNINGVLDHNDFTDDFRIYFSRCRQRTPFSSAFLSPTAPRLYGPWRPGPGVPTFRTNILCLIVVLKLGYIRMANNPTQQIRPRNVDVLTVGLSTNTPPRYALGCYITACEVGKREFWVRVVANIRYNPSQHHDTKPW